MSQAPETLEISSPGLLKTLLAGLPALDDGDTVATVTGSASDSRLTVSNAAATTGTVTIDGGSYTAGRAVQFDLEADSGMLESEEEVYLDVTTVAGERMLFKHPLKVRSHFVLT